MRLYTRSGLDRTNQFPPIAADVGGLPAEKLVLDGEVISADAKGHPSFPRFKTTSSAVATTAWCITPLISCTLTDLTFALPH